MRAARPRTTGLLFFLAVSSIILAPPLQAGSAMDLSVQAEDELLSPSTLLPPDPAAWANDRLKALGVSDESRRCCRVSNSG